MADTPPQEFTHRGFTFTYNQSAKISNAGALERLSHTLATGTIPLPEMTYGSHFLSVSHPASGFRVGFTAEGALGSWHALQVSNSLMVGGELLPVDVTNYDYTYTSAYDGEVTSTTAPAGGEGEGGAGECAAFTSSPTLSLPLDLLRARGPILAFASLPLYASDLNDRGVVEVGVKLRVMEDFFLVLCRSFTRLDRDLVRVRDVRYFHKFGEGRVLRDVQLRVGKAGDVAGLLAGGGRKEGGGGGPTISSPSALPTGLPSFLLPSSPPIHSSQALSPTPKSAGGGGVGGEKEGGPPAVTPPHPMTSITSPTSPTLPTPHPARSPVHPVVLASMRERAAKRGLRVLDDGTIVGADNLVAAMSPEASSGATHPPPSSTTPSTAAAAAFATHAVPSLPFPGSPMGGSGSGGGSGGGEGAPPPTSPSSTNYYYPISPPLRLLPSSSWGPQETEPWPARPGASPPPLSPTPSHWQGPMSHTLAITADDTCEALAPCSHLIQCLELGALRGSDGGVEAVKE